jgi:hypothetical protein
VAPNPLSLSPHYLIRIDARLSPFVDAVLFRLGDPLDPTLAAQVGFELGEYPEPIEGALAGRRNNSRGRSVLLGSLPNVGDGK